MDLSAPIWETIDPTPNIHNLFMEFNQQFFYNKLSSVTVSWSKRMTLCAGSCTYRTRKKECFIKLSEPLLKLRSRKDLLETLFHEMIHAYLFVTKTFDNRSDHGPEFLSHMRRINSQTNLNISVYHNFNDEVQFYQKHWWRCNGICKDKPPYYGIVKRAMNRKPSPNDYWWLEHEKSCGGQFIKIREPDKITKKNEEKHKSIVKTTSQTNLDQVRKIWNEKYPIPKAKVNLKLIQCDNCDEFIEMDQFKMHLKNCNKQNTNCETMIECGFCEEFISEQYFAKHFESCEKMRSSDSICETVIDLFDLSDEMFDNDFEVDESVVF